LGLLPHFTRIYLELEEGIAARNELDESYEKLARSEHALAAARSELRDALNASEHRLREDERPTTVPQVCLTLDFCHLN
jgi:prefoldin subunit 5